MLVELINYGVATLLAELMNGGHIVRLDYVPVTLEEGANRASLAWGP